MKKVQEPNAATVELDKIPGAWVITWWLPDGGVILRLRAQHSSLEDDDRFVAQVKMKDVDEFDTVHEFRMCIWLIGSEAFGVRVWKDLPTIFTEEFKALVMLWARVRCIAELGEAGESEVRYASEPHSSRDHIAWAARSERSSRD